MSLYLRDVLSGVYDFRHGGLVVALRCYFDDSGSHRGSPVFVWAGWIGTNLQWEKVEPAWERALRSRGIKGRFNMAECAASDVAGEFGNRAQRDSLIYDLREILLAEKMTAVGVAIVAEAWSQAPPWIIERLANDPNRACAAICVAEINAFLEKYRDRVTKLAMFFDGGAAGRDVIESMVGSFNADANRADAVAFLAVAKSPALQAADMIAWELRHDTINYEAHGPTRPFRPHFQHFVDRGAFNLAVMNKESIDAMWRRGPPPNWKAASGGQSS